MIFEIGNNLAYVLVALIAAIPAIVAARYAYKANHAAETTSKNVDGKMDTLLKASTGEARALGRAEGQETERERGEKE